MNILVIGNGFDLAHGLPTKYTDFLEFVKVIKQIVEIKSEHDINKINWGKISLELKGLIENELGNVRNNLFSQKAMWKELLADNVWIEYFLQCDMHGKENWIDFESEISEVIKSLDEDMSNDGIYKIIHSLSNNFFNNQYTNNVPEYLTAMYKNEQEKIKKIEISFKELRDILCRDLDKLIRAFEVYLTQYVGKITIKYYSPDIEEIEVDKILSFNYTNTFEKLYAREDSIEFDYIHGKADFYNTLQTNNMVLGIDEYLGMDRKDKDTEFIAFKKFYQRIHKETGAKYKHWVQIIRDEYSMLNKSEDDFTNLLKQAYNAKDNQRFWLTYWFLQNNKYEKKEMHNVYIFGHSLDITDRDILKDIILNDNVYTTIYYFNKEVMGQQIANLVKVIGQEELIKRTGGSTKTIEFKQQQNMLEVMG